jgi:hypothetical protein
MQLSRIGALTVAALTLAVAPARAQSDFIKDNAGKIIRKVGVHVNVGVRTPLDDDVSSGTGVGVSVGLSPGLTNGWKYPVSLSWYHENLISPNGVEFAQLRAIGLLGGIGYGWHFGQLSTSIALQGGYSFNKGSFDGDIASAFPGVETASLDVGNAFVVRPRLNGEYYLTHKFTLRASADYVWMKPDITVTTPSARYDGVWDASSYHFSAGIGFYPFRK